MVWYGLYGHVYVAWLQYLKQQRVLPFRAMDRTFGRLGTWTVRRVRPTWAGAYSCPAPRSTRASATTRTSTTPSSRCRTDAGTRTSRRTAAAMRTASTSGRHTTTSGMTPRVPSHTASFAKTATFCNETCPFIIRMFSLRARYAVCK